MKRIFLLLLLRIPRDAESAHAAQTQAAFLSFLRRHHQEHSEQTNSEEITPNLLVVEEQTQATVRTQGRIAVKAPPPEQPWSFDQINETANVWALSPDETMKLSMLQERLQNLPHPKNNPHDVARFLKEYSGDVEQCESQFRQMIEWRQNTNADSFLENYQPPKDFAKFPAGILKGRDWDGDPVHVERTGAADGLGLLRKYGREEMVKHGIWLREIQSRGEWLEEYEREEGHKMKSFTVIMDFKDLNRRHLTPSLMSAGQEISKLVTDNYPGYAKRFLVIRTPGIFHFAWNAFKPFIDESTRKKIVFLKDKDYYEDLKQYLDPSILPIEICPEGSGQAIDEISPAWEGGLIGNAK
ncbi:unnamed protein product [Cylindrotheca closterium]|uniref:CRAL-TRIO domain-containing protein n=1 Tax=Cylindrotheca closterium TaxID=2856 RepID=A0AAD2FBX2_9STRA|nr:unnamed protein product [Cylindrotheca closterium]